MEVKYSTTGVTNTIKSNNIVMGNSTVDYGPTEVTGFYTGVDPPPSGYTIYLTGGPTGLNARCASNDNEVILIAREYGGTNVNTINEAIAFFVTGSTGTTIVNTNYPEIIFSGLTLSLDAGFLPSYPRSGNTWRDLSGNNYIGVLSGGTTYNSNAITFDGNNDAGIVFSFPFLSQYTISIWVKPLSIIGDMYNVLIARGGTWASNSNYCVSLRDRLSVGDWKLACYFNNVGPAEWNIGNSPLQIWNNFVITKSGTQIDDSIYYAYRDGISLRTGSTASAIPSDGGQPLTIAMPSTLLSSDRRCNASISQVLIYNRALSASEILYNYNATKFKVLIGNIVTDSLSLCLDAGVYQSYPQTGSTWYDLSDNQYNGTLLSGTSWDSGSIVFSGDNDYVDLNRSYSELTNNFTICTWVYPGATQKQYAEIFGNHIGTFRGMVLQQSGFTTNYYYFAFGNTTTWIVSSVFYIPPSQWTYISAIKKNNAIEVYLNCVLSGYISNSDSVGVTNSNLKIGWGYTSADTGTRYWNGKSSCFQIYNKVLSSSEIAQNYIAMKSRFGL